MMTANTVILPMTGPSDGCSKLVKQADAHRGNSGAEQVADATDDHDHEAIDDVSLSHGRANITDL